MADKLPSVPEYFKEHVDPKIVLEKTPYIPCPFHNEKTGKSFSYSKNLGIWRCFGACHCGGDVVMLHKLNHRMKTREEAERALYALYDLPYRKVTSFERKPVTFNENDAYRRYLYATALRVTKTVDDYLELDYLLSKVPFDTDELTVYCTAHGCVPKGREDFKNAVTS